MLRPRRARLCLMHLQDEVREPMSSWGKSHWAKPDIGNAYELVNDADCEDRVCIALRKPPTTNERTKP